MTETDFFRILRVEHPDYAFFAARNPRLVKKPYTVTLRIGTDLFQGQGASLPEAMYEAGMKAGLEFRSPPRATGLPRLLKDIETCEE